MISDAVDGSSTAWRGGCCVFPAGFLVITTLAFNLLGDGLRDALDPRYGADGGNVRPTENLAGVATSVQRMGIDHRREGSEVRGTSHDGCDRGFPRSRRLSLQPVAASSGSSSAQFAAGSRPRAGRSARKPQTFGWTNAFDPTGEYLGSAWALYDQLLMRGLYTYNHRPADEGGNAPVPDLAASEPTVSDDGLTWDFTSEDAV